MDSKFVLGIFELDAQHAEIDYLAASLREVAVRTHQRHLAHPTMRRLRLLLRAHFVYEESLMGLVKYQDLPQHRKMHIDILRLFNDCLGNPSPAPSDYEHFGKLLADNVLGHVMEHDVPMTGMLKEYLAAFKNLPVAGTKN